MLDGHGKYDARSVATHDKSSSRWRGNASSFLAAATISMYGDWLTTVALIVLLFRLTGSAVAPAGYVLVRVAPRVVAPMLGGALADRRSPARVLAVCWVAQGALTASLVPISWTGSLAGLFACVAAAQFLTAFSSPCTGAIIPRLGARDEISKVNRIFAVAQASSVFVAPLVASAILLTGSASTLLVIDAATFVVGAAGMATIRLAAREPHGQTASSRGHLSGVATAFADPVLRVLLATFFAGGMAVTSLQAVLVVAAAQRLGSATQVGALYAVVGFGGIAGSLIVLRRKPRRLSAGGLALVGLLELTALLLLALIPFLATTLLLLALSAIAGVLGETWGTIDLQERVSVALLGRVSAAVDTALYAGMLTGALLALGLAVVLGWQVIVVVAAASGLGTIAVAFFSGLRPRGPVESSAVA